MKITKMNNPKKITEASGYRERGKAPSNSPEGGE